MLTYFGRIFLPGVAMKFKTDGKAEHKNLPFTAEPITILFVLQARRLNGNFSKIFHDKVSVEIDQISPILLPYRRDQPMLLSHERKRYMRKWAGYLVKLNIFFKHLINSGFPCNLKTFSKVVSDLKSNYF